MRKSKLELLRVKRSMSQHALAEAAGITQPYICQIETGRRRLRDMRRPTQIALAVALGVTVEELLHGN